MKWKEGRKYILLQSQSSAFYSFDAYQQVFRIQAIRDFGDVKKGDLGGFVQSDRNLAHDGTCWLYGDSLCIGNAVVYEDAKLYDTSKAIDYARIHENAVMLNESKVAQYGDVFGSARLKDEVVVGGSAKIFGQAILDREATVAKKAQVFESAYVSDRATVCGKVYGNAEVLENALIYENTRLCGVTTVKGDAVVLPGSFLFGTESSPELLEGNKKGIFVQGEGFIPQEQLKSQKRKIFGR
ncbi:MAG: hypothetical protein H2212_03470 [Ruminococcus sp.]|nr:hypothetical protein [Ruminococcus sp.]